MRRVILAAATATVALFQLSAAAEAPADAIKYRQAIMAAMGGHIAALGLVNMGRVPHQSHLQAHADALADLATQAKVAFPANSGTGETEALPLIWQEQDRFNQALAANEKAAAGLKAAIATGDKAAIGKAFAEVGKSCKGCHDRYREAQQ
jgi:cytochrome c556